MKNKRSFNLFAGLALCVLTAGCGKKFNPADGAPPATQVVEGGNMSLFTVAQVEFKHDYGKKNPASVGGRS